jgi:hypothetical protein
LAVDWKPWLIRWSREWIASAKPRELEPDTVRDGWLGYAPATPDAVAAAEARLGVRLPPSYRDFLLTTDGWRHAGIFVSQMRGTSSLSWLRDVESFWAEHWDEFYAPEDDDDDDYSDEGPESRNPFRPALLISLEADSGILFLNPEDVNEAGEWAAYSHFSWRAEPPVRFDSFTALMEHLHAEFHQMRHPAGETRDTWDNKIEQARVEALAGQIEDPVAVLAQAQEFGRSRAGLLRAQLLLFLGQQDDAHLLLGHLLSPNARPESLLTDPLFTEEILPLLFIEHDRTAGPAHASVLQAALIGDRPEIRELEIVIAEHQARLRRPDHRLSYGNREFDSLIRAALARHRDEPDALWPAVKSALPRWRPRSSDHIAPVVLLAEPATAAAITPARGRELLSQRRGGPVHKGGDDR